jgi:hypothetical protein
MVKDEAILLDAVLPIWSQYPIKQYIFYNDDSRDETVDIIKKHLGSRAEIINNNLQPFHESRNRHAMYLCSLDADYILSLDADELVSANFFDRWDILEHAHPNLLFKAYNLTPIPGTYRTDPKYKNNYFRIWARPDTIKFNLDASQYHSQRRLPSDQEGLNISEVGNLHLQSINPKFYVLKQLWYKHFEYVEYGKSIEKINKQYDGTVNKLKFNPEPLPEDIIGSLTFDPGIFDRLLTIKPYETYIRQHRNDALITFGHKFI